MSKRYFHLWPEIVSFDNLWLAYKKAAATFERRLEDNLITLQEELRQDSYTPGLYASFYVHDPKRRLISAVPFRDRVVHHALGNVLEPIFERKFIFDSYGRMNSARLRETCY